MDKRRRPSIELDEEGNLIARFPSNWTGIQTSRFLNDIADAIDSNQKLGRPMLTAEPYEVQ